MDMKQVLKDKFHKSGKSRGQGIFGIFIAIGIGLIIIAVILGLGAYVITEIDLATPDPVDQNTTDGVTIANYPQNITNASLEAMNTVGSWLNIYVIIAIAVAIIGLIFLFAGGVTRGEVRGMSRGGGRRRL